MVLQSSVEFVAVSKGFGKTIEDTSSDDLVQMQKVCKIVVNRQFRMCSNKFRPYMRATSSISLPSG